MNRFPLLYRIGEDCCPEYADEKVRCEAGIYKFTIAASSVNITGGHIEANVTLKDSV